MLARRSELKILYKGIDISKEVQDDLKAFTYTDNASGAADDISITLKDNHKKWMNSWFPNKGDIIQADILTHNWRKDGEKKKLPCGLFMVDDPGYSGRPRTLTIKAISVPVNGNFMTTKRSKVWKKISMKQIASEIAKRYNLKLFFESPDNPVFDKKEQTETADAAFLDELCKTEGLAFKASDQKLVIFDEATYEKRKSVAEFHEEDSTLTSYNFNTTFTQTAYAGCKVSYYDAKARKKIDYLFSLKEIDIEKDKVYKLNARVKTEAEARRLAQKTLRKLNKREFQGQLEMMGDTRIYAGCCIDLKGFGVFSGKWYVEKATHSLSGYTTSLEIRRVLEGY
ncbi:phage late control D family protein [Bacillus infantis]|nr:contractile injection system protein, VgrG/Pvc8 family [Bacillus infantis]